MAYCSQCGGSSNGAFCPQCGASMTAAQPQAQAPQPQQYPPHQQPYFAPPPARKSNGLVIGLAVGGGVLLLGLVAALILLLSDDGGSPPPVVPADRGAQGGSPSPAPSPAPSNTPTPSTSSAGKVTRKPGYVTGIVLTEQGAPLKVPGSQITVRIAGNRSSDMQEMAGFAPVQADGRFELKVPDGTYAVTGYAKVNFQGSEFWLTLDPAGGPNPQPSKDGLVKELRLKLTGLRAGMQTGNPYNYYGGHIRIQYQGQTLPDDAKVTFTLTPTTPLADGSQGKPLTFTTTVAEMRRNAPLSDIPLAKYRISGEVTLANGTKKAALISHATGPAATSQEFTFKPNTTGEGIEGVFLWMKGEQ